jgi:hypothetical protein
LDIVAGLIKSDLQAGRQQCQFVPVSAAARACASGMLALFTKSWRRKAAIVALVFYALGIAAPGLAMALTEAGAHCVTTSEAKHEAASHHVDGEAADMAAGHHGDQTAPAADNHGVTGKCCGSFCVTALPPGLTPFAEPLMQISATPRPLVGQLLGHGPDRIDRPPRSLSPL